MTRFRAPAAGLAAAALFASLAGAQESLALFDAPVIVLGTQHRIEVTLDLDGDGDQDAVGWWWQSNLMGWTDVRGYTNDGDGRLTQAWDVSAYAHDIGPFRGDSAAGDFDGDVRDDFAFGMGNDVYLYTSNGASDPTVWDDFDLPNDEQVDALELADLNGDGLDDVIVGGDIWSGSKTLRIYLNPGNGSPTTPAGIHAVPGSTEHLITADIDGDGAEDAVVAHDGVVRFLPISNGTFGAETSFALTLVGDLMPVAGDVDGDGDEDVVVFSMNEYQVLRRTGPASFDVEPAQLGGPATDLVDIDGDGDLDGACCGGGSYYDIDNVSASLFRISHNDGTGAFAPAFTLRGLGAQQLGGAVDMDADGDVDLVAGRVIYYANGPLVADPVDIVSPSATEPSELMDVDRDGDPDIAMGLGTGMRNAGDGTTSSDPPPMAVAPAGTSFVGPGFPGDFDGDGDVDLVVQHVQGATFLAMRLLRNNGGGGFVDGGPAGPPGDDFNLPDMAPNSPEACVAADFDDDGDLDLATNRAFHTQQYGLWYEFESRVFWNDGAGSFTPGEHVEGQLIRGAVDIDGDGDADLITQNDQDYRASWRPSNGDGTWLDPLWIYDYFILYPYEDIELADYDGDGDVDAAAIQTNEIVRIAINDGTGDFSTFDYPFNTAEGQIDAFLDNEIVVRFLDLDDDGDLDLVAGPIEDVPGSVLYVLREPGGWAEPVGQMVQPTAFADMDGDGDIDGVSDRLVLNRTYEGHLSGRRFQYGAGKVGSGGLAPTLGGDGPYRFGESPTVRATGAVGGTAGLFAVSTGQASLLGLVPGATVLVDPFAAAVVIAPVSFTGAFGVPGAGEYEIQVNVTPTMVGRTFFHQMITLDLGATGLLTTSNGLELVYGG